MKQDNDIKKAVITLSRKGDIEKIDIDVDFFPNDFSLEMLPIRYCANLAKAVILALASNPEKTENLIKKIIKIFEERNNEK